MTQKQREQFQRLADRAQRLAWSIADKNEAPCGDQPPPPLEVARYECIKAFTTLALALKAIFQLEPSHMS